MLRAQIELYKVHHDGRLPSSGLKELLLATNASGTTTAPAPYGPYAMAIPVNPYNNSSTVVDTTGRPPAANVAGAGYLYNPTTGNLWVNESTTPFAQQ
jgi:hypothetical protein